MDRRPVLTAALARRVAEMPLSSSQRGLRSRLGVHRPLVVGPAILLGPDGGSPRWRVHVSTDGRLVPLGPRGAGGVACRLRSLRASGATCRPAAALLSAHDVEPPFTPFLFRRGRGPCAEFYGWSLLYQGRSAGVGLIDPHDRFPELPAFYESAQELLDRAAFLAARGVASRAVALLTEERDFSVDAAGRHRNRFYPQAIFCRPQGPGWPDRPARQG